MSTTDEKSIASSSPKDEHPVEKVKTHASAHSKKESMTRIPSALPPNDADIEYPGPLALTVIMLGVCLSVLLVALDQTIIATAIPKITDVFGSLDDVGWYGSAYLLTTCAFQLFFGRLYSFFPIKTVYLATIALFELGSLICGVAPNSTALIVGRAIAGLGCSGIFSGAILILAYSAPLERRPMLAALLGSMWAIASVAGPLLGGVFTDHVSWRWCFYINLPIGAVTVLVIIFFFHAPQRKEAAATTTREKLDRLDFPGLFFFLPGIICLLLALQWGGVTYPWGNWRIIILFVIGGLCLVVFTVLQPIRGDKGTLPPRVLKNRTVWSAAGYAFCLGAAFFVLVFYIPIWFQAIKNVSATNSGIRNLPLMLGLIAAIFISGGAVSALGYYTPWMILCSILLTVGAGLLTTWKVDTGHAEWIGYQALTGIGIGFGLQQTIMAVQAALPMDDVPTATAIIVFAQSLGGALILSAVTNVFNNKLISNLQASIPEVSNIAGIVLSAGATRITKVITDFNSSLLPRVLVAYNDAVVHLFYASVALGALSLVFALTTPWISIKGKKVEMTAA